MKIIDFEKAKKRKAQEIEDLIENAKKENEEQALELIEEINYLLSDLIPIINFLGANKMIIDTEKETFLLKFPEEEDRNEENNDDKD